MPCISDLIIQKDIIFKMPLQSDAMDDLIHFVGHRDLVTYISWTHLHVILKPEITKSQFVITNSYLVITDSQLEITSS